MARRGYSKMRREEEDEWRELLGRAHGVVKRGPKKEKQRYRKGRLVLILKKTISDHDDKADKRKSSKKSSKKKSKPKLLLLENGSATARSESSQTTNSFTTGTSTNNTNNTSRTSLGKTVRGGYKSYSEKFLAEQEEEKRQCMLAIAEGRPLPDSYGNDGGRLLLTDGTTAGTTAGRVPVDPSEDHQSSQRSGSSFSRQSGESSGYSTKDSATSATEYSSGSRHPKSVKEDFKKSAATLGSNRKGVYGGGVRYFTPDNVEDDESEESAEDEDFEEEEDAYDEVYSDSEEGTYDRSQNEDTVDCDGSDLGSMFGEEEETIDYTKGGVESVDGSASERDGDRKRKSSRGRRRDAPKMDTIDDGSASSGSR